jgi:hypothetical protein
MNLKKKKKKKSKDVEIQEIRSYATRLLSSVALAKEDYALCSKYQQPASYQINQSITYRHYEKL